MALNSEETVVIGGGNVFLAPVGTVMPTELAVPGVGWNNIGYISEDGPSPSGFQRDKTSLFAWNTSNPLRTSYAPAEPTITFTLLQFDQFTLQEYFGGGTFTAAGVGDTNSFAAPDNGVAQEHAMIIDWVDGLRAYRWQIPKAAIAASGDMTLTREQFLQMPVAASILAPSSGPPFTLMWSEAA